VDLLVYLRQGLVLQERRALLVFWVKSQLQLRQQGGSVLALLKALHWALLKRQVAIQM
jgi:hypothetical protein